MTTRESITTGKPPNRAPALWLSVFVLLIAASAPAFAHGSFDHIRGTVAKIANNVLTVKTATGNVDVKLDNKTELTRNNQKAEIADLKVGARVIVDVPKGGSEKAAHSVKIGAVPKTADPRVHGSPK